MQWMAIGLLASGLCLGLPMNPAQAAPVERIYGGLLPGTVLPASLPAVRDQHGRIECVQLLKALMAAPRTLLWQEGRRLKTAWDEVQPGTAIATFNKGRYPQKGRGNRHAAIFLRANESGIYVFDQFASAAEAGERFIPWHHPHDRGASNNAAAYSTVRW